MTERMTYNVKQDISNAIDEAKRGYMLVNIAHYTEDQIVEWVVSSSGRPQELVRAVYNGTN